MSLTFTGESGATAQFELLLEAYDGPKRVVVVTSSEAFEDHGLAAIQAEAGRKYAHGITDDIGRVSVLTTDFR